MVAATGRSFMGALLWDRRSRLLRHLPQLEFQELPRRGLRQFANPESSSMDLTWATADARSTEKARHGDRYPRRIEGDLALGHHGHRNRSVRLLAVMHDVPSS